MTATAEEHLPAMMAKLMGEANRSFAVQAQGHAEATEKLTHAASAGRDEIATHVSAKETAEKRAQETWVAASDTIAARDPKTRKLGDS